MSHNTNNTIYNISNVQQVLINSPLEGIKMLPLNTTISVKAIFGETRKCHRAGKYESQCQTHVAQKDTKTCSCTAALQIKQYISNCNVVTFCQTRAHVYHVPSEKKEIRTLPLPSEAIRIIEEQLKSGSSCRSTRISVLRQIDD
ncbi:hypothetical protein PHYBLDRAFT_71516 [Phycomyces blakesleeanus NRRL 1555(-)]|uniref:Uncharacterized protein n=1 Tax=Phycomyces blakesleeanus (strain ATCC 8743b / DSM 1359 / FGSC 10004 / NBRC 33097 / NRRL 1555) TaxID=763407 RepID=A0A167LBM0_PHYB8|nr:hypothetical protein PHYBLDRAFT_71516 [Phycomyces blakesleeanus NRRL 1555(-)]OAD70075.1 hypothetical protein PHYBLDRAFT_71516 [Phycomyces blakesleeanus NRRL 1555(-)]|eukprot:XP_018288115.1 hypothetical protein PHYBLDRAFT_71516 [Phycomyces blakesleeanus NRRL 1555(-)]